MSEKPEKSELPANPENHPERTVEALERNVASEAGQDEKDVVAEDVTDNPDTGELEGLPGPSPDEPGEPAG